MDNAFTSLFLIQKHVLGQEGSLTLAPLRSPLRVWPWRQVGRTLQSSSGTYSTVSQSSGGMS